MSYLAIGVSSGRWLGASEALDAPPASTGDRNVRAFGQVRASSGGPVDAWLQEYRERVAAHRHLRGGRATGARSAGGTPVAEVSLRALEVHEAIGLPGAPGDRMPTYVTRDVDLDVGARAEAGDWPACRRLADYRAARDHALSRRLPRFGLNPDGSIADGPTTT